MATLYLGMRPDEHEFKVMGLAPYSKQKYVDQVFNKIRQINKIDGMRIIHDKRPQDLYSYLHGQWVDERFDNIAGGVQKLTEVLGCGVVKQTFEETGIRHFAMGGGVAMNVKMNMAIADMECVDYLFVPGSGSDETLSIGGCYLLNAASETNKPLRSLYLGYNINDDSLDFEALNKAFSIKEEVETSYVADLLASGDIVARVSGRCEFGARALGNRSILADPSKPGAVKKINEAIKNRDFWMPFALSILADKADLYVNNKKGIPAQFMSIAFDTFPGRYREILAGTHPYDFTVRPQYVHLDTNSDYYNLIHEFEIRTGIPALLNTSFNLHGEPIANNVFDAIKTFENSEIDHLLFGHSLLSKK